MTITGDVHPSWFLDCVILNVSGEDIHFGELSGEHDYIAMSTSDRIVDIQDHHCPICSDRHCSGAEQTFSYAMKCVLMVQGCWIQCQGMNWFAVLLDDELVGGAEEGGSVIQATPYFLSWMICSAPFGERK